jgi:glycosyltransferase involved in cell wall biosynthesis
MEKKNLAVIASRLKCVDAISVEADKWIDKYCKLGYNVCLIAGKFGEPTEIPHFQLPEMDYKHPEIRGIKNIVFNAPLDKGGKKAAEILMGSLVKRIKGPLKNYLIANKIQILSIEDSLISLKNIPLHIALSEITKELNLPTVSRYHYVPWNNQYFSQFNNIPKITANLPPAYRNIVHITNTESSKAALAEKRGIHAKVIPNTIDLDKLAKPDEYNNQFRKELGIRDDQLIFLQPTRVKRNKFVERAIKLVAAINDIMKKDNVLLITGSPVYSRGNYFEEIVKKVKKQGVNVIFANDRIFLGRHHNPEQNFYSIHDAYLHADVVLYPSTSDAFGNPLIEAMAYKKPVVVNTFPNLRSFTEKGFRFVVMDQKVDNELVSDTYELLLNREKAGEMVEHNFELLKKHYSSDVLDDSLMPILNSLQEQKSFISKVAGFFPDKLWRRDAGKGNAPERMQAPQHKDAGRPKEIKAQAPQRKKGLKNKKGGYKEPVKK